VRGLVLWIDGNEFSTKLVEKVFKQNGLSFYALSSVSDFAYLIEDLSPSLIVVDAQTALNDKERFLAQYQATQGFKSIPVVIIDPVAGLEFLESRVGQILRPFDPFSIPKQLGKLET